MTDLKRRDFLKTSALTMATAGIGARAFADQQDSPAGIPTRPLGRSGERVSIVGMGGYHIGTVEEREAIRIMHEAIDKGMTFFDNAWDYHKGGSEEVMGKALATGGRRQKVFLMTKNCARDYKGSLSHLEDSLRRLKTDRIDLWQFHEVNYDVDPDWIFSRGALKAAIEAKKAGKVRYIGFTGHKDIKHHLAMLGREFDWDACQMPISVLDAHYRSFQKEVLPECTKRKISPIAMKGLASQNGRLVRELGLTAEVCRRYTLSLPVTTTSFNPMVAFGKLRSRERLKSSNSTCAFIF